MAITQVVDFTSGELTAVLKPPGGRAYPPAVTKLKADETITDRTTALEAESSHRVSWMRCARPCPLQSKRVFDDISLSYRQ